MNTEGASQEHATVSHLTPHDAHSAYPMVEYYVLCRASITADVITACRAGDLYDEAKCELEAGLCGDLAGGFCFWSLDAGSGLRLVRCRVMPMSSTEIDKEVRDHRHHSSA